VSGPNARAPRIGRSATVLLLIDFVNPLDFAGAERLARYAVPAARRTARLKERLARRNVRAVYANDHFGAWRSDFTRLVESCRRRGGASRALVEALPPAPADVYVLKPRHSAFFATPLEVLLQRMRTRRLVLTGIAADLCVTFSAVDAYLRGYELWIPSDCVAAETPAYKREALAYLARALRADTRPSESKR
jgi:nicotinamidase-related amidase